MQINAGPRPRAPFRSLVYAKGEGGPADLQEVYYSWWYNGRWTPDVGKQKQFERIPSMYKVHLARRVDGRARSATWATPASRSSRPCCPRSTAAWRGPVAAP